MNLDHGSVRGAQFIHVLIGLHVHFFRYLQGLAACQRQAGKFRQPVVPAVFRCMPAPASLIARWMCGYNENLSLPECTLSFKFAGKSYRRVACATTARSAVNSRVNPPHLPGSPRLY